MVIKKDLVPNGGDETDRQLAFGWAARQRLALARPVSSKCQNDEIIDES